MNRVSALPLLVFMGASASACFNPPDTPLTGEGSSTTDVDPTTTSVDPTTTTADPSTGPDPDTTAGVDSSSTSLDTGDTTGDQAPEIQVSIDGVVIESGDGIDLAETVAVGEVGSAVTVTVENLGMGDLQVGGVLVLGTGADHVAVDQAGLASTIAAGDSSTFTVALAPQNGGIKEAVLSLSSDDADENPFDIVVRGHTAENTFRQIITMGGPSGRFTTRLVDLRDGRLLLFGGRDATGARLNDTWVFEVETSTWTELAPPIAPVPRSAHGMVLVDADTVLMFGGSTSAGGGPLGDTWVFDVPTEQWTSVPGPAPSARLQHGMVSIGDSRVLLFGGMTAGSGSEVGETWIFDGTTDTWQNLAPVGGPAPTSSFALAYNGMSTATLFGGLQGGSPVSQTWRFNVATNNWTLGSSTGGPGARFVLSGETLEQGRMVVWSGKLDGCCNDPSPGTFAYDPVTNTWANLAPAFEPTPRFNYGMAAVEGQNKAIVFGGVLTNIGVGTAQSETWEYVGLRP